MACRVCLYLHQLGVALDRTANAVLGGSPEQTLSSRFGRAARKELRWAVVACAILGFVFRDPGHCEASIVEDDDRRELLDLDGPDPSPGPAPG